MNPEDADEGDMLSQLWDDAIAEAVQVLGKYASMEEIHQHAEYIYRNAHDRPI